MALQSINKGLFRMDIPRRRMLKLLGFSSLIPVYFGFLKEGFAITSLGPSSFGPGVPIEALWEHTGHLVAILDKRAGSPGLSQVRAYIQERLKSQGFFVQSDPFQFLAYRLKSDSLILGGKALTHETFTYSSGLKGRFPAVLAQGASDSDSFSKGAFMLVPIESFEDVPIAYQRASLAGAAAVAFSHKGCPEFPFASSVGFAFDGIQEGTIPALSIPYAQLSPFLDALKRGELTVEAWIEPFTEAADGLSFYAFSQQDLGSNPLLLLGAHFDTWFEGATDDCASVALLLELARTLKQAYPSENLGFLFLDAEEIGLLGAYRALQTLVVDRGLPIKAFLNLEQAVVSPRGFVSSTVAAPWLFGDALLEALHGSSGGFPVPAFLRLAWSGGAQLSNLVPFYNAGIPSLTTGPLSLPTFNHTPADTLDKVSDAGLHQAFRFFLGLASSLLREGSGFGPLSIPETPRVAFERRGDVIEVRLIPAFLPGVLDATVLKNGFIPVFKANPEPLDDGLYRVQLPMASFDSSETFLFIRLMGAIPAEGWLRL
jgi:aminopeptidase YwaD